MPRQLSIQYPEAIHHACPAVAPRLKRRRMMSCGDRREVIFREETTMSLKWIAERLQMGSWTYVSNLLSGKPDTLEEGHKLLSLCL